MDTTLAKIKRLILVGQYDFSQKAELERLRDGLTRAQVLEAIINANGIKKVLRSYYRDVRGRPEKLYVIESFTFDGILVYTKGVIKKVPGREIFYLLVSSKRSGR